MILTGAKLEEIGRDVWGDHWIKVLSIKLDVSKRTIMNWRDGKHGMPSDLRRVLLDLVETQMAIVSERHSLLAAEWDDIS